MSKRTFVIVIISIIFFLLVVTNYFINLHILKSTINDLQTNAINNASERVINWMERNINSVKTVKHIIHNMDHIQEQYYIKDIIEHCSLVANFAYMFIGYNDNVIISSRPFLKPLTYNTTSRPWYKNTINTNKITITKPYISNTLKKPVVAVCIKIKDKRNQQGVLCGILPLEEINKNILNISLPYDGSLFLVDQNKKILVHRDSDKLFKYFNPHLDKNADLTITNKYIFSQGKIKYTNWSLISQLDKAKVYERVDFQLKVNMMIYFISLVVFLWLNLFYNKKNAQSQARAKRSQALMRCFIESDDRGCLITDDKHNVTYMNNEFTHLLGVTEQNPADIDLSNCAQNFKKPPAWTCSCLEKMFKATKEKKKSFTNTFSFFHEEKKVFLFFTSIPVKNSKQEYKGLMLIVHDVTNKELNKQEHKEQEDILIQQTKMADLGEMLGAISHQWRQPLNSLSLLLGNILQFKQMNCLSDDILNENIKHALENTKYLTNTINTFQDFYLPNKKIQTFDLLDAINETNHILEPYFKNSEVVTKIISDKKNYICYSYKNEFQQIISCLILNAKDAICENSSVINKAIEIIIEEKQSNYCIKVIDYAKGISPSIEKSLFKPFQTTKGKKGTGSGLYLSKLIAKNKLLGDLNVLSYKDPTAFLFTFPKVIKENHD